MWTPVLLLAGVLCFVQSGVTTKKGDYTLDATMPGKVPTQDEEYSCHGVQVPREGYIVAYNPVASVDRVHHMILFGCDEPGQPDPYWMCMGMICKGRSKILYAWARNAPALDLPQGVGFHIGGDSGVNYLVAQVHYAKTFEGNVEDFSGISTEVQLAQTKYLADIYLFASGMPPIPPQTPTHFMNMSCTYENMAPDQPSLYAFAFRTHTHDLGRVVSAFKIHDKKWSMIGKRNPLWPQMFQPIPTPIEIAPGDVLAAQCRFNSTGRHEETSIGMHGHNEMCNFYMMYYRDAKSADPFERSYSGCGTPSSAQINEDYPAEGSALLPPKPQLEEIASLNAHNFVRRDRSFNSEYGFGGGGRGPYGQSNYPDYHPPSLPYQHTRKWKDTPRLPAAPVLAPIAHSISSGGVHLQSAGVSRVVEKWTIEEMGNTKLGQVAGLALGNNGELYIFHRGNRVWDANTFTASNELATKERIDVDTVLVVDVSSSTPRRIAAYGKGLFYLPHGIFVDKKLNIWTTDTGSHQVKRFKIVGDKIEESGSWGELLVPGSDEKHFCKPAGVAVTESGQFFVADGYCNSRIVSFNADGTFNKNIGERTREMPAALGSFILPHDITLHEEMGHIHVADRQNGRMQMLFYNGTPIYQLTPPPQFSTVYSVDYCALTNRMYILPGEKPTRTGGAIKAFALQAEKGGHVMYSFAPTSTDFKRPHVIRLSHDCSSIFVADLGDAEFGTVFKFELRSKSTNAPSLKKVGAEKGDKAAPPLPVKPTKAGVDLLSGEPSGKLWMAFATVFALTSLFVLLLCVCLRFKKQGGFKATNVRSVGDNRFSSRKLLNGKSFKDSREGFMPLATADIDAVDDLTDDSEFEDTLYTSNQNNSISRRT